jgi:hypothetical protein
MQHGTELQSQSQFFGAEKNILNYMLFTLKYKQTDLYSTNQEVRNINTRSNINLHLPVCNLTLFQKGAYFSGTKLYNHLPLRIKSLSNEIKLFKPALKGFLNTHSFYSVDEYLEHSYNQDSRFLNNKQLNWNYNCKEHNYTLYTWNLLSSSDKNDYYIIFLMYDNVMFCARYIYKYDTFYVLLVIVI